MLNQEIIFLLANKYIKNLCYLFNGPVINKERKFDHPKAYKKNFELQARITFMTLLVLDQTNTLPHFS